MASSITVNGNTYSDGDDPATGMGNGGFRTRLLPMLSDTIADLGRNMVTTSTTSVAIGTGSKSFTMAAAIPFAVGAFVEIASAADGANFMWGQVTARSDTALTVDVAVIGGSGTFAAWHIQKSGARGPTGDVAGPGSSTNTALARWDGAEGDALQDSGWRLGNDGAMTAGGALDLQDEVLARPYFRDMAEAVQLLGTLGAGTTTIDLEAGNVAVLTGAAVSATIAVTHWPASGRLGVLTLEIANGGAFAALTWPAAVDWVAGEAPTLSAGTRDTVVLWSRDGGSTINGNYALNFS
ncbi:MAG: hypothetical protein RIB84_21190 [Sneathiellaceae bacterium]